VNAEMKIGTLEETVTVTGAAPLVDTQNVRKQTLVSSDLLNVLPSSVKNLNNLVSLTPGFRGNEGFDITGGYTGTVGGSYHGKGGTNVAFDGMQIAHATGGEPGLPVRRRGRDRSNALSRIRPGAHGLADLAGEATQERKRPGPENVLERTRHDERLREAPVAQAGCDIYRARLDAGVSARDGVIVDADVAVVAPAEHDGRVGQRVARAHAGAGGVDVDHAGVAADRSIVSVVFVTFFVPGPPPMMMTFGRN